MSTLLLDLDGTLTDPRDGIVASIRYALECLGEAPPPDGALERFIGPPLAASFTELLGTSPGDERIDLAISRYRERFAARGWRENRVYPGIPELLDALRGRGWRCVVATSKPGLFAERIALHFDLRRRLDGVYGSELDGRRGEKPELLAHVLETEAVSARRAIMLGDRRHDVLGARANGMRSIGAAWGYGSRSELEAAGADRVCASPAEVPDALAELGSA